MKGIIHSTVPPYTHVSNGIAERFNRTIGVMVRTMLLDTRNTLSAIHDSPTVDVRKLWGEAISMAVYLKNRLPHCALPNTIIPYESLFKHKPTISHLQLFGKFCRTHISKERQSCKLSPRAERSISVGYNDSTTSILKVLSLNSMQVWEIRGSECKTIPNSRTLHSTSTIPALPAPSAIPSLPSQSVFPGIFDDLHDHIIYLSLTAAEVDPTEPRTYKQAMTSPESSLWQAAIDNEIASMHSQNVWTVVHTLPNLNSVGSKWLFRLQRNEYSEISCYKARLAAQGFTQQPGVNFDEVYAPVVRLDSLCLLLSIAAYYQWEIIQLDIEGAFLYVTLSEEIYMKIGRAHV